MKRLVPLVMILLTVLAGCGTSKTEVVTQYSYNQISQDEAKVMMEKDDGHVVVDVRRQDEYDAGHIPGAILIPNEGIGCDSPEALPDYDQIILIYCRSGNRSKQAAEKLAAMGYKNIYEFGGINTWAGDIVTGDEEAGHLVKLSIESNPTTGFSWEAVQDEELLDIQGEYVADPQDEPVEGAGGMQIFTLTPVKAGRVQVTFTYTRSWEPSDVDPQFSCVFEIGEDMQITVLDDGKEQARSKGFISYAEVK